MELSKVVIENIEKHIQGKPCHHYAFQDENRNNILMDLYSVVSGHFADADKLIKYIYEGQISSKKELVQNIYGNKKDSIEEMLRLISTDDTEYILFIEDFDKLIHQIDPDYSLSKKLIELNNLYMTISSTSDPETLLTKSPYFSVNYFQYVSQ
jgi:hypothetical protein